MQHRNHPDFGRRFIAIFLTAFVIAVSGFVGGFLFIMAEQVDMAMTSFGVSVGTITLVCIVLIWRLYTVRCPGCTGRTRTVVEGKFWRAECDPCRVSWKLAERASRQRR